MLGMEEKWESSKKLRAWFHPLDLCLLDDPRNISAAIITNDCIAKLSISLASLPPIRCRVANTWPSRSAYCDPTDIPFNRRQHLISSLPSLDEPTNLVLTDFFLALAKRQGLLLMIGDSVMQQFFSALACELERENVWPDHTKFTNTDESRTVQFANMNGSKSVVATIKFLPIYHLVNGRYDRVPMAALQHFKNGLKNAMNQHSTIIVLINMGLHYVDNPIAGFSKQDYIDQMTTVLTFLHRLSSDHPRHTIKIVWRETTAQHFATPNGYWPGVRYAQNMKVGCVPIADPSPQADWRNRAIEHIVQKHQLSTVQILRFYNLTLPLWSEHPNGNLKDCTHFCWFPMLYQPIFHYLKNVANSLDRGKS